MKTERKKRELVILHYHFLRQQTNKKATERSTTATLTRQRAEILKTSFFSPIRFLSPLLAKFA
jgi:hypothetical protein